MGDKQDLDVVSPSSELDLSPIIEKLEDISNKQGEIIEQNKILIDYFVPTDQEIQDQKEQELKDQEIQDQKEQELKDQEIQEKELLQEYNNEVLEQLTLLNENISNVGINTEYSNNYSYLLLLFLLLTGICCFIYKIIKKFIY